ncbi:MAG: Zn-dependent protease [Gammaproteobacteria bacterium]|jgi:Zn-dependent protease
MITLLYQQQYLVFGIVLVALLVSLSLHEFGHAAMAQYFGDDTAAKAGRLTINPVAHIDPMGLLMVVLIGIGYAKPVPTNPAKFNSRWGVLFVAAAGPAMNLLLAIFVINLYQIGLDQHWAIFSGNRAEFFFTFLALINLLLMLFNLIPIGPLDGHYILPYFLNREWAMRYIKTNALYGNWILLSLIVLNFAGVPIFQSLWDTGQNLLGSLIFV